MVEAAGIEPDENENPKRLMACGLHGQRVAISLPTTVGLVPCSPPQSPGVDPSLGDILETLYTCMGLPISYMELQTLKAYAQDSTA